MQELNFTPTRARRLEHSQSVKRYNEYSETAQTNTAQSMAEGAGPCCRGSTTVRHSQFRRTGLPLTALLGATALWAAGCLAQVDDPQAEPAAGGPSVGGAPMAGGGGRSAVVPLAGRSSLGNAGTSWMSTSGAGGRASGGSVSSGAVGGVKNGGESGTLSGAGAMNAGGRLGSSGASNSGGTPNGTSGAPTGGSSRGGAASTAEPELPPITGSCPAFKTGTATIGGLNGISLQVGPKREGTGALLFYWHGTGSRASEVNSMMPSSVRSAILDEGGIIVSFQGSVGMGGDCSGTSTFSKDDFKIADTIAACAVRDHGINPRRIYTTGCSAGGLQAGCMGAMRSNYIAATVPNSGGEVTRQPIQNRSTTPAVMTMHGGSSDRVVVSFSSTSATFDAHMKEAGSFVINCNHGGGHCRAPAALYTAAWEFMKAHPFGVEPEPYASGLPESFPSYCKVY